MVLLAFQQDLFSRYVCGWKNWIERAGREPMKRLLPNPSKR